MRLIKWLFGLAITLAVLLALLPIAGKHYALYWFEENGYDAKIKSFNLNPFTGQVTLAGFDVRNSAEQGLQVDVLEATFKIPELFEKEAIIRKLKTQGVRIDLGKPDAEINRFINPVEKFVNRHMPEWRFGIVNSSNENAEVCREGAIDGGEAISQCFSIGSFSVIDLSVQNTSKGWQLSTRSSATFQRIYFKDHFKGTSLMYIGDLQVRDVVADSSERRISQITLKSFHLVERSERETERLDTPYQTQIESLLINDIVETRSKEHIRISLGLVDMTALRQTLHRNRDAGFVMLERLRDISPAFAALINQGDVAAQDELPAAPKVIVSVLKTRVVDGGLAWLDDSVSPPAQEAITGLSFELGPINSGEPDQRTPVLFDASLGDTGSVKIKGRIAPFAEYANFELEGSVKGFDISKVSAYTETLFAEKVQRGLLDTRFRLDAHSARLQGDASIRFTDLKTLGGSNRDGVLSLQNAYNKLKTSANDVDFDTYFDFDLVRTSSLGEAVGRDIRRTLSNLANGRVAKPPKAKKVSAKTGMSFEPLKYSPKTQTLMGAQATRFKDIMVLVKESPNKTLTLCPITTGGEWAALYRQGKMLKSWEQIPSVELKHLTNMSTLRAKALRDTLSNAGIESYQYKICEPRVELSNDGPSFVSAQLR